MHFLNQLVNPESGERLTLLYYLLAFVSTMMVTYLSIAATGSAFSLYFNRAGRRNNNPVYRRFARNLIDMAIPGKGAAAALAGLPIVTILLIYAELLYDTNVNVTNFMAASTVLIILGFFFLLAYKYSFRLEGFLESYNKLTEAQKDEIDASNEIDVEAMEISAHQTRWRAGIFGTLLLWIGMWIFMGGSNLAFNTQMWSNASGFFPVIFSWGAIWSFIHFIAAAVLIESAAILFFFYRWDGGIGAREDKRYSSFVKRFALTTGLIFAIAQPLLILLETTSIPSDATSGIVFGLGAFALFIVFVLVHFFYSMLKQPGAIKGTYAFIGVVVMVAAWMASQGVSFSNSNESHYQLLADNYEKMVESLPTVQTKKISGEHIYKQICSACHRFDRRLVGPAYNMVLPNYVGKLPELEHFIDNPTNALKGYPPMPKQNLNSAQVHAVAEYILNYYLAEKKNGKAGYTE